MLDRLKLIHKIQQLPFTDGQLRKNMFEKVVEWWSLMVKDTVFLQEHCFWQTSLLATYQIDNPIIDYTAVSIDGSQIYPNRHSGCDYCLINIGGVVFHYGLYDKDRVLSIQEPLVFPLFSEGLLISHDWIDAARYGYELEWAIDTAITLGKERQLLVLIDGSLIYWHLEQNDARDFFLEKYSRLLLKAYDNHIPLISYISRPKNKDLVDLLRRYIIRKNNYDIDCLQGINDTHLVQLILKPLARTTVFCYEGSLKKYYPVGLEPCFVYFYGEMEVARIECASWIANNDMLLNQLLSLVADQVIKGAGYPIVIAEAHNQAVVKHDDREFFLYALSQHQGVVFQESAKQFKKNNMYY